MTFRLTKVLPFLVAVFFSKLACLYCKAASSQGEHEELSWSNLSNPILDESSSHDSDSGEVTESSSATSNMLTIHDLNASITAQKDTKETVESVDTKDSTLEYFDFGISDVCFESMSTKYDREMSMISSSTTRHEATIAEENDTERALGIEAKTAVSKDDYGSSNKTIEEKEANRLEDIHSIQSSSIDIKMLNDHRGKRKLDQYSIAEEGLVEETSFSSQLGLGIGENLNSGIYDEVMNSDDGICQSSFTTALADMCVVSADGGQTLGLHCKDEPICPRTDLINSYQGEHCENSIVCEKQSIKTSGTYPNESMFSIELAATPTDIDEILDYGTNSKHFEKFSTIHNQVDLSNEELVDKVTSSYSQAILNVAQLAIDASSNGETSHHDNTLKKSNSLPSECHSTSSKESSLDCKESGCVSYCYRFIWGRKPEIRLNYSSLYESVLKKDITSEKKGGIERVSDVKSGSDLPQLNHSLQEGEDSKMPLKEQKSVNTAFVEGLDDIDKFLEEVEPPDELDVGASGSSIQEVLAGQGAKIIKKHLSILLSRIKRAIDSSRLQRYMPKSNENGGVDFAELKTLMSGLWFKFISWWRTFQNLWENLFDDDQDLDQYDEEVSKLESIRKAVLQ
jgi:hypothetical protein